LPFVHVRENFDPYLRRSQIEAFAICQSSLSSQTLRSPVIGWLQYIEAPRLFLGLGWFDVSLLASKMRLVLHDVVQHWHWLLTRELLHQIVRSGKDSIATILGHGRYMLLDVRGVSHLIPDFPKGIDLDRNVGNSSSEDLGEEVSHFVLR
jgi:hypothetical protein